MSRLSIITVNYNNRVGLEKTVESVMTQTGTDFEYIIVDGGSDDGSLEVIHKWSDRLDEWVSEPDNGIYHAMNKGISKSQSEYLLFLNSGDWLTDPSVLNEALGHEFSEDIIYMDCYLINGEKSFPYGFSSYVNSYYCFIKPLCHQAMLIKRQLFEKVGNYDDTIKVTADWQHYMLALFKYKCSYKHLPIKFVNQDITGISTQSKFLKLKNEERDSFMRNEFPNFDYRFCQHYEDLLATINFYQGSRISRLLRRIGLIDRTLIN